MLGVKTPRGKQNIELLGKTEHYNGGNIKVEEAVDDCSGINELFKTDGAFVFFFICNLIYN